MASAGSVLKERESGEHTRDRRQGKLACAECRRSKLKCDRVFPCQSCIRRGCASICPDGMLAATKGNKILIAQAERLNEKVKEQAARIEELEKALFKSSEADISSRSPGIESASEMVQELSEDVTKLSTAVGSLAIGSSGQTNYHGEAASSEMLHDLLASEEDYPDTFEETITGQQNLGLPSEIFELAAAFPFGLEEKSYSKSLFVPFIPPQEYAVDMVETFYQYGAWMWEPISRSDTIKVILNQLYRTGGPPDVDSIHAHNMGLLFLMFAFATLCKSHPQPNILVKQFEMLSKAAIALVPMQDETTIATVQSFFVMNRFLYQRDRGKGGNQRRWLITGMCIRLAQSIGLHRDPTSWGLDEEEIQRRRLMFWELFTHDCWVSITSGRPPSMNIEHIDCRFPKDVHAHTLPSGDIEQSWHAWKYRYAAGCLVPTMKYVSSMRGPSYGDVLALDKRIRSMDMPSHLQCPGYAPDGEDRPWSSDPYVASQQFMVLGCVETNLLLIHRSWFTQAVREAPANPPEHKYGASVLAVVRSCLKIIAGLKGMYAAHPDRARIIWVFWSGLYSACISLAVLILESPASPLARNTLPELDEAITLYDEGSRTCRPPSTMAQLKRLQQRVHEAVRNKRPQGLTSPRMEEHRASIEPDEIEVLAGRRNVVASAKRSSNKSSPANTSSAPSTPMPTVEDFSKSTVDLDAILRSFPPEFFIDYTNQVQPMKDQVMTMDFSSTWIGEDLNMSGELSASPAINPSHAAPSFGAPARRNLLDEPSMFATQSSQRVQDHNQGDAWSLMDSMSLTI